MCSAHCLMVLYIGVNFHENISNGIRDMEQTQNYENMTDRYPISVHPWELPLSVTVKFPLTKNVKVTQQ